MRLLAPSVLFLLAFVGCSKPAIEPTSAGPTKDVIVCWQRDRAAEDSEKSRLREAFKAQLRSAGYALQRRDCHLRVSWTSQTALRNGIHVYTGAKLTLRDAKKQRIDAVEFEFERRHVLVSEPEKVAILFVNEMNKSAKLIEYAASRAKSTGEDDTDEAAPEEPATATTPSSERK